MKGFVVILAITVAAIVASIFLFRSSGPVPANPASSTSHHANAAPLITENPTLPDAKGNSVNDFSADLAHAFQLPDEDAWKTITDILEHWGASHPKAVFDSLLRQPEGDLRHNALIQLAAVWAESNPQIVADTYNAQTSGDEKERGVAQAVTTWAKNDPMAALDWVNQNSSDLDSRNPLKERFYSAWASVEPEAAARYALANDTTANELAAVLASWAHSDLEAAFEFQKKEFPADKQAGARKSLLLAAAGQNSPLSETLLNEFLAGNPSREEALRIAKALSSLQPKLAYAIADALPQGPDTEALRNRIASFSSPAK